MRQLKLPDPKQVLKMSTFQLINSLNYELMDAILAEQPADADERAMRAGVDTGETALAEIVTDIMDVSSVDERLVLFLTPADLVKLYLQKGGGGRVIDNMDDGEIQDVAGDLISPNPIGKLIHVPRPHKFVDFISPPRDAPRDRAVLIDIPKSLFSKLKALAIPADSVNATDEEIKEFRDALKVCMLHKYYVLSLNLAKTKEIRSDMARARNVDAWVKVFNPRVIENFPKYQTLQAAKDEWDEMTAASAPSAGAPAPSPAPSPAPAGAPPTGTPAPAPSGTPAPAPAPSVDPATVRLTVSSIISTFVSSGKFDAVEIADDLKDSLLSVPKAEALAALEKLRDGLHPDLLKKIMDRITADQTWA